MSRPLVVLYVAGVTSARLARLPRVAAVGAQGFRVRVEGVLPAAAGPAQATFLTGLRPDEHGVVGSGWFERDLGEILDRPRYAGLVRGEPLWGTARRSEPGYHVANLGFEFALGAGTDLVVSPGGDRGDWYTAPPIVADRLQAEFGPFPDPGGAAAAVWMAGAARHVLETDAPDLTLVALPARADEAAGPVLAAAERRGAAVVVLSAGEGDTPVQVNGRLAREGLLTVWTRDGVARPDPWESRAFAVEGPGAAHVYVRDPVDLPATEGVLATLPGVEVLAAGGKRALALDAPRSGDLVVVPAVPAEPLLLCSEPSQRRERIAATEVRDLLLAVAQLA